mgnify:CR=1 FL=1
MCDLETRHLGIAEAIEDKQTSIHEEIRLSLETLLTFVVDVSIVSHHDTKKLSLHRVQIEIEFMFEFCADCQYHHVPIFVLHGYRTFVKRFIERLQCHASSESLGGGGEISKELFGLAKGL